jgi:class 3 adenylate cyclase
MLNFFNRRPDLRAELAAIKALGLPETQAHALADFFERADPRELARVNPRLVAERLGLAEREALRLLVTALHAGVVNLHWEVRCPGCGSSNHRGDSLAGLHHNEECGVCQMRFNSRFDEEVRVSFSLHERLRGRAAADDPEHRSAVEARLGAVPGHALMLLPDFQQLFPQQRLLPDESLDVTRAALLFTDLAGSTAIYARRGDPRAYHLVRLHFDELFRVAGECGGLMVKTIGDAVMAAFQTPAEALRAALGMQQAVADLNRRSNLSAEERLILKVGLHSGPCLAVTLNDRPDYFGTTVNVAARVQGLSQGGDIVLSEAVRSDPQAYAILGDRPLETTSALLKGIDEPMLVHRFVVGEAV